MCILEAARHACGYRHKAIEDASEIEGHFSPVLCEFAMALNDAIPDELRDAMLYRFIERLAHAHIPELEKLHHDFILTQVYRRIFNEEPFEDMLMIDLVSEIDMSAGSRKWYVAVQILEDALNIREDSEELRQDAAFERLPRLRAGYRKAKKRREAHAARSRVVRNGPSCLGQGPAAL